MPMTIDSLLEYLNEYKSTCQNGGQTEVQIAIEGVMGDEISVHVIKGLVSTAEVNDSTGNSKPIEVSENNPEILYINASKWWLPAEEALSYVYAQMEEK